MIPILLAAVSLVALPSDARLGETAVRLSVRPMATPKPVLKYQLLPEVRELQTGNAVQWYLRCFMEQRNFFFAKESVAERTRYQTMPLKDLPADKLRTYGGSALTQADWGARLDTADWQVLDRVQNEGTDLVLPELSSLRRLAGTSGPVPRRGRPAGFRRRRRHRQDDARARAAPGRTPHVNREPPWVVGRRDGLRHARRDGAATGLSQPLLGAHRPANSAGRSPQGSARRPRSRRGRTATVPRSPHDRR